MVKKKVAWKDKKVYTIVAPEIFNWQEIGTTFTINPKNLIRRTVILALSNLTNDKTKQPVKITFEINEIEGNKARTKLKSLSLDSRYIRSKLKKGVDKIECLNTLNFQDSKVWSKIIVITHQNTQGSKIKSISAKVAKVVKRYEKSDRDTFLQAVLFGKLGTDIYREVKKIVPIKRVEVERLKSL